MSEFDIRIGTQLDTSEAEAKLAALVSKYNDTPINLSVNVNGAEKLTALQNSLTKISTLAKGLGNIKVDVGSNVGSISADMSDKIKTDISALIKSTDNVTKQLGEGTVKALGNSTNQINKQLDSTKNKIDNMISNLQNIKLTGLKDGTGEIDKTINKLKEIKSLDFGKLDESGISKVNSDLSKLNDTYKQLITSAKNNQLQNSFNSIKIDPLLKQMEAVRDVLSAKNMDTSWINNLINKMNTLKSSSADLSSIKNSFKGLKDEFSNLTKSMDVKGITSVETALQSLTKYRNELNNKITMAVDDSEVKQLKSSLEQVDNAISKMKQSLAFGASSNAMGQLIDSSQLQNAENMKKKVEEIGKALDGFKQKSQQLKGQEFVDISKLMAVDGYIKKIEDSINKLDFKNIDAGDVQKIANDMKVLENAIQQTSNASKNLKLEAKFDADFSKVEQQLNGLHSALIKAGGDTSAINQLKQQLNSIKDLGKVDLGRASAELGKLGDSMKNMGKDLNLGKVQGDIKQYLDYVKQLQNAQKQLANTKDTNIAKGIESEISRIKSAMSQLENGFDSTQKKIASGFKESFKSQDFTSEINKMQSALQKLQSVANSMGQNSIFSNLTSEGGKLSAEFNKLQSDISQLGQKLQQALKLGNIDASGVQKLQQEIMQTADSAEKLSKIAVNVECDEAISSLNKLEQEMKQTEESSERLKNLKSTYSGIADQVNNGTKSFAQATKEINSANKESNNFATSIGKAGSQVGGMTSKIEGAFSSIKNAFSDVGLGMLLANGVQMGVSAIKDTIVDLDASLADLKRVLPDNVSPTVDNLKGITADAKQIAIDVGQSTENVIQGMATALQVI